MIRKCPECGSINIELMHYVDIECLICKDCGYDEREIYDQTPEERISQKEKARYSPYKTGGKQRSKMN